MSPRWQSRHEHHQDYLIELEPWPCLAVNSFLRVPSASVDGLLANAVGHKRLSAFRRQTHLVYLKMWVGEDLKIIWLRLLGPLPLLV